jgi:hypothetical protein
LLRGFAVYCSSCSGPSSSDHWWLDDGRKVERVARPCAPPPPGEAGRETVWKRMTWSRQFANPIALKDGRTIGTLAAARALILSLPELHQRSPTWHETGELLAEAANDKTWVPNAEAQLSQALEAEGLV